MASEAVRRIGGPVTDIDGDQLAVGVDHTLIRVGGAIPGVAAWLLAASECTRLIQRLTEAREAALAYAEENPDGE